MTTNEIIKIRVSAMLPLEPQSPGWHWVHCLTFPLDTLNRLQFTPRPYKWIRYAIGAVVGAQGDLSFSCTLPLDTMDYNLDFPSNSVDLFYHISSAERQRMFPVDPDMNRTNVTSSASTSRRDSFRDDVLQRDGQCVLTGFRASLCDAVHLLSHSKGNEYIKTYTQRRSRDPAGSNIVEEIDDVRNGILLNTTAHITLGKSIALLMTPNFAMTTTDVSPTASPTEKRCTAHRFVPDQPEDFGWALPSEIQVQIRGAADNWPPDILFDAVYGSAILNCFPAQELLDKLKQWKSTFYPRGITSAVQASYQAIIDERVAWNEKKNEQNDLRDQRVAKRGNRSDHAGDDYDFFDVQLMLPYIMMSNDQREVAWRKAEKKRAEMERSRVEDRVVGWQKEVAAAYR